MYIILCMCWYECDRSRRRGNAKRNGSSYSCVCASTFVISSDRTRPDQYELLSLFGRTGGRRTGVGGRNEISSLRTPQPLPPSPLLTGNKGRPDNTIFCVSRVPQHHPHPYTAGGGDECDARAHTHTYPLHPNGIFLRTSAAPLTSHSIRVMYNASQYARDGPPPRQSVARPSALPPTMV